MEKQMKKLNATINRNGDAKMMMMSLVNGNLSNKMGCDGIVSTIMEENLKLSETETIAMAKRLAVAVNKFKDAKPTCRGKNQRYDKLMAVIPAEIGKETAIMSMVYSDISEHYDISSLSTSELSDVCCWLVVKSLLWELPTTGETMAAAQSYKKQQRRSSKEEAKKQSAEIVVVEQQPADATQESTPSPEDVTVEILKSLFSEENIRKAVHNIMDGQTETKQSEVKEVEIVESIPDNSEPEEGYTFLPLKWMKMVNCLK